MLTLAELQEKLIERVDEVDIIDLLELTTADIVYMFVDRLVEKRDIIESALLLD